MGIPETKNDKAGTRMGLLTLTIAMFVMWGTPAHATSFTIGQNFTGSTFRVDSFSFPPDSMGSVGPNHFVELINGRYSVYQKSDGNRIQTSSLNQFWRDSGVARVSSSFDPRVVYDHASQRWFGVAVDFRRSGNSNFLVGVSQSSDPTAGWTGFSIDSDSADIRWADFPSLGVDRDGVYVAANMFDIPGDNIGNFTEVTILSLPKADLLSSAPSVANASLFENIRSLNFRNISLQPTVDIIEPDGGGTFLAASFNETLRTDVVNAQGPGPAVLTPSISIDIPFSNSAPDAIQPNGVPRISTFDRRFSSAPFEAGNRLWAVNNIGINGRAAIQWYEFDEVTNNLVQHGLISDPFHDYFYPSIAANEFGDVVIGFNRSGEDEFVSAYAAAGETRNGITTFGDPILLKAGVDNYLVAFGGRNRWGDYSATSLDPTDSSRFWTIQEWVSGPNIWSTQITELILESTDSPTPTPIPEPTTFLFYVTGLIGLVVWKAKNKAR